jgi:hypothetical protein
VEASLVDAPSNRAERGEPCTATQAWNRVRAPVPNHRLFKGVLARQQVDLLVPPDAPPGRYAVALQALPGEAMVCVGEVVLRPQSTGSSADAGTLDRAADAVPLGLGFEEGVHLVGYDRSADALAAGETLYLTLYWRAREPVEQRYKVFTHLLGEAYNAESGGFVWGQQDNEPVNGARPTTTWRSGEVIEDVYALHVTPGAPPGTYTVEVGLYDPATLRRLRVLDEGGQPGADHVVLGSVRIENR